MKNILFIVGSNRKDSFNLQLAKVTEDLIKNDAKVTYLNFKDVPFINQDEEYPAPKSVKKIRDEVDKADALWFFTPEYNHSFPGLVKNLVDWLSRPIIPFDFAGKTPIKEKVIALSGAAGASGSAFSQEALTNLLTFVGAKVIEKKTLKKLTQNEFRSNKLEESDELKNELLEEYKTLKEKL